MPASIGQADALTVGLVMVVFAAAIALPVAVALIPWPWEKWRL